jgi:hypothetical protein
MIWAAIWVRERSDITFMQRDPHSKKEGYSAASYVTVLNDQLPRCWEPGIVFMQDNALIHRAGVVMR